MLGKSDVESLRSLLDKRIVQSVGKFALVEAVALSVALGLEHLILNEFGSLVLVIDLIIIVIIDSR